ncbi:hypothetical protein ABZW18_10720 [Streptomyces sp. NPDC004647]|uniref:hypothetical protein n=1 Tax=Streptomyces sp. NPDC004647 TaxID=3154671 RepID=UPI0033B3427F
MTRPADAAAIDTTGGTVTDTSADPMPATPRNDDEAQLLHLRHEVEQIVIEARTEAQSAQRRGAFWNATYLLLGFPAAVLAGVAGAAGLASPDARVPAAIMALLSAGFAAGSSFLRADARQLAKLRRRYAWQELEMQARLVLAHEAYQGPEQLHAALADLLERRRRIPSSALVLSELQPPTQQSPPLPGAAPTPPV